MDTGWQTDLDKRARLEALARKILGVGPGADAVAIKKAYWLLAMKHHPDKAPGDPEAERRFNNIAHAYEFLTRGHSAGWRPTGKGLEDGRRRGYRMNEWGYFCHWRTSFMNPFDNEAGEPAGDRRRKRTVFQ